jgi:hypothetical protein
VEHDILPDPERLESKNIFCPRRAIVLRGAAGASSLAAAARWIDVMLEAFPIGAEGT